MNITIKDFSDHFLSSKTIDVKDKLHDLFNAYGQSLKPVNLSSLNSSNVGAWFFDKKDQVMDTLFSHRSDFSASFFIEFLINKHILEDIFPYYVNHFIKNDEHLFYTFSALAQHVNFSLTKNQSTDMHISFSTFEKILHCIEHPLIESKHWEKTLHYLNPFYQNPSQDSIDSYQSFLLHFKPLASYSYMFNISPVEATIKTSIYSLHILLAEKHQNDLFFLQTKEQNPILFKDSLKFALYKTHTQSIDFLALSSTDFIENQFISLYSQSNPEEQLFLRSCINDRDIEKIQLPNNINTSQLFDYLDGLCAKLDNIDHYTNLTEKLENKEIVQPSSHQKKLKL